MTTPRTSRRPHPMSGDGDSAQLRPAAFGPSFPGSDPLPPDALWEPDEWDDEESLPEPGDFWLERTDEE